MKKYNILCQFFGPKTEKYFIFSCFAIFSSSAYARSDESGGTAIVLSTIVIVIFYFYFKNKANEEIKLNNLRSELKISSERKNNNQKISEALEIVKEKNANARDELKKQQEENTLILNNNRKKIRELDLAFSRSYINGRKWLAEHIAELNTASDESIAKELESKKNPAPKAATEVRKLSGEKKELLIKLKYLEYTIKTYHEYYPILEEYNDDILNEQATLELNENDEPDSDRVINYISEEEYSKLSVTARNQLALEKWKSRRKSNVEIGRIYERYLGYLYEKDGWEVSFTGALDGLADMGRDLLCVLDENVHVVQAKYWSKYRTIHEKHIFQLYGTSVLIPMTHPELRKKTIKSVFATTTNLSSTAVWVAKELGVKIKNIEMNKDYPVIKCNINAGKKIYHLPFDQQYDRVKIIPEIGEFYALSVVEAEKSGFRRAKKHYG